MAAFQDIPWWTWTLQAFGVATAYVGAELNARLRTEGFYMWIVSNVVLAVVHAISGLWLLLVLDALFLRLNLVGIRRWAQGSQRGDQRCFQRPE